MQGLRQGEQLSFLLRAVHGGAPAMPPDRMAKPPDPVRECGSPPTTDDFRAAIARILANGQRQGLREVRVRAGDLHREVGGYPGPNARMPSCCNAMRDAMAFGDEIVEQPPERNGASLESRFALPR